VNRIKIIVGTVFLLAIRAYDCGLRDRYAVVKRNVI